MRESHAECVTFDSSVGLVVNEKDKEKMEKSSIEDKTSGVAGARNDNTDD